MRRPSCGEPHESGTRPRRACRDGAAGRAAPAPRIPTTWRPGARAFVGWLLSRDAGRYADAPNPFRRRAALFWADMADAGGGGRRRFRVVYVDGIWIARDCVVLIACSDEHVLSWHLARRDDRRVALAALAHRPARHGGADGGSGFASAVAAEWPRTRVQMRVSRVLPGQEARDVEAQKLQASVRLYALARELLHVETLQQADWWVERFAGGGSLVRLPRAEKLWSEGRNGLHPLQVARGEVGARPASSTRDAVYASTRRCAQRGRCPPPATGLKGA